MVASIPNDIFQYSIISALNSGLATGGPPAAFLTRHGTHGIGTFAHMNGEMILIDSVAWQITSDGNVRRAALDAVLPYVMVTIFEPVFGIAVSKDGMSKGELEEVLFESKGAHGGGPNSYMPFRIHGKFKSVQVSAVAKQKNDTASLGEVREQGMLKTVEDVKGTIFGFASPPWAQGISVAGVHCHFLSEEGTDGKRTGGHVKSFELTQGGRVEWAVCGRFHLGLPSGDSWEELDLKLDSAAIEKAEN